MRRDEYNQGSNLKIALVVLLIFGIGMVIIGGLFVFTLGSDDNEQEFSLSGLTESAENLFTPKPTANTIDTTNNSQTNTQGTNNVPANIEVSQPISTENIEVSTPVSTSVNSDAVDIHFMSVGEADAILIKHNGEAIMVDAGKSMRDSDKSTLAISDHISDLKNIKWLLTTHQDYDHIGNALYVMKKVPTEIFYDNGNSHTSQTYLSLMTYLNDNSDTIDYTTVTEGKDISPWSDVKITVAAVNSAGKGGNDDSVVLLLEYEGTKVALVGDISETVESEVAKKLGDCDILKVAHHGSATSSTDAFLSIVKPELSVISVGTNSYGHPTDEALTRLMKYGKVYRTDEFGCVEVVINDGKYEVRECTA